LFLTLIFSQKGILLWEVDYFPYLTRASVFLVLKNPLINHNLPQVSIHPALLMSYIISAALLTCENLSEGDVTRIVVNLPLNDFYHFFEG
jgi:hypothetical protein